MKKPHGGPVISHIHLVGGQPASVGSHGVQRRLGALMRHLPQEVSRWLDVGCGNGAYTAEFAKHARLVVGVDVAGDYLRELKALMVAERILRSRLLRTMGEHLPFADDSFDVVSLIEVLEHVSSEAATLLECRRVLRPGGLLAISVPNKWYPFETHGAQIGSLFVSDRVPFVSWLPRFIHERVARARIYTTSCLKTL